MKSRFQYLFSLLVLSSFFVGCTGSKIAIIEVFPQKQECTGVSKMECLKIKYQNSADWQLLYSGIRGFDFEPGFHYQLKIRKTEVKNPPVDGSSIQYKLLKMISKEKAMVSDNEKWQGIEWTLIKMGNSTDPQNPIRGTELTLTFQLGGKSLSGKAGCNGFFSDYEWNGKTLKTGMIGATEMYCIKPDGIMKQEQEYLGILSKAVHLNIEGAKLVLKDPDSNVLIFKKE